MKKSVAIRPACHVENILLKTGIIAQRVKRSFQEKRSADFQSAKQAGKMPALQPFSYFINTSWRGARCSPLENQSRRMTCHNSRLSIFDRQSSIFATHSSTRASVPAAPSVF